MPETDWQALDARIARMMGFEQKEAHGEGALFWVSDDGEEYLVERPDSYAWMDWDVWQPHKNVAQALEAAEALFALGYSLEIARYPYYEMEHEVWIWSPRPGHDNWFGRHTMRAKAICSAIGAFLDAPPAGPPGCAAS